MADDLPAPRRTRPALVRYLVIGGASVAIDVGLLFVLHSLVDVPLGLATASAFVASLIFNFVCNRLTMAGSTSNRLLRHAFRYGLLVVANLAITEVVVTGGPRLGVPYLLAKLGVVVASTGWNFVLYRRWVFAEAPSAAA